MITYRKTGRLRYLSHLDVTRAIERALRRAAIPVAYTQGYNQRMRLSFGPPLPVGAEGMGEVFTATLQEKMTPAELVARLSAQLPWDLGCAGATVEPDAVPSPLKRLRWAEWQITVSSDPPVTAETLQGALERLSRDDAETVTAASERLLSDVRRRVSHAEARDEGREVQIVAVLGSGGDNYLSPDGLLDALAARLPASPVLAWSRAVRLGFRE